MINMSGTPQLFLINVNIHSVILIVMMLDLLGIVGCLYNTLFEHNYCSLFRNINAHNTTSPFLCA